MEEVKGAEIEMQAVAQPEGAENNQAVAQPNVSDMDDTEFSGYIKNLQAGNMPKKEEAKPAEKTEEKEEPFKSFKTEEEFQQFMNKTVGERLKKSKEAADRWAEVQERAKAIYGDENAVDKVLQEAERSAAEEAGISAEEYTRQKELERDANLYRASVQKEKAEAEAIHAKQEEWRKEEEALKAVIPDFDFMKAMEDENFRKSVLEEGMTLSAAYIKQTTNRQQPAKRPGVYEVGRGSGSGKASGKVSPNEMSDSDFSLYIKGLKDRG